MSNIKKTYKILKVYLIETLFSNKRNDSFKYILPIFIIFSILAFSFSTFSISEKILETLQDENKHLLISFFAMLYISLISFTNAMKAKDALFGGKDTDFLLSIPIKEETILSVRIMRMSFQNYLIEAITLLPAIISYSLHFNINWFITAINLLMLPLIPIVIASTIGCVLGIFVNRFKLNKILQMICALILISLIFDILFSSVNNTATTLSDEEVLLNLNQYGLIYPLLKLFTSSVQNSNYVEMIIFVLINISIFVVFLFIFKKSFIRVNQIVSEKVKKYKKIKNNLRKNSHILRIFKRQINFYVNSPTYFMNSFFSTIFVFGLAIISFNMNTETITILLEDINISFVAKDMLIFIIPALISLCTTTSTSISMEGTNLWCLRSMPIKETEIFYGKMLIDILIMIPINMILLTIISINCFASLQQILLLEIIMISTGLGMSHLGIIINLIFPKIKSNTESEAAKENLSGLIVSGIPMFISCVLYFVYNLLKSSITMINFTVIITFISVLFLVITSVVLRTYGVKKINELPC